MIPAWPDPTAHAWPDPTAPAWPAPPGTWPGHTPPAEALSNVVADPGAQADPGTAWPNPVINIDWPKQPICPDPRATAPQWQPYVAAGATRTERAARLAEAPEHLRARIESHVRTVFAIRAAHRARARASL